MRYVLDTDAVSYYLRGDGRVAEHLAAVPRRQVALTTVTVFELWRGAKLAGFGKRRTHQLRTFIGSFVHLPLGTPEAERAAEIAAQLEAAGKPIGRLDTLIAGIALAAGAAVVSRNAVHFGRVSGLQVVNWYD